MAVPETTGVGPVESALARYARRKALVATASRAAAALLALLALVLAALAVDRVVELPRVLRPVLPLAAVVAPLAMLATLLALLRRTDPERLAGEVDSLYGGSRDVLRSALNLRRRERERVHRVNPFLLTETVREADAFGERVQPAEVVRWGSTPLRLAAAGGLAAVFAAFFFWPYMGMDVLLVRLLDPMGNHPRPSLTRIAVSGPLTRTIPAGDDVCLEVRLSGRVPEEPQAMLHVVSGGREQVVVMTPRPGNRFESELRGVASAATLFVTAGDGRSARYRILVIPRPSLRNVRVRYDYPRYTRLARVEGPLENRQVTAVVGTQVRLSFASSLPVRESDLTLGQEMGGRKLKIRWDKTRTQGAASLRIERDTTFRINLLGDQGTDNRHDPIFRVRAIQDNPPTVALTDVPASTSFFRDDILRLGYKGSDDFGISEAFLRCRQEPGDRRTVREWSVDLPEVNARATAGSVAVDLRELTDEMATGLEVQLVMADTNGEEGAAPPLRLQIVADSSDRQLQDLLRFHEAYAKQLAATARALRAKVGQLGILIDGLDDQTALTPKRKEMLRNIDRRLGVHPPAPSAYSVVRKRRGPVVLRSFPHTEAPYHSLRKTEECLRSWQVLRPVRFSEDELRALEQDPTPRKRLVAMQQRLADQSAQVDALAAAFADTVLETRLRLTLLLAGKSLRNATAAGGTTSGFAAELAAEKQQEMHDAIAQLAGQVGESIEDEKLRAALAAFAAARQLPADRADRAIAEALRRVYAGLLTGPSLDGRLGKRLEAWRRSHGLESEVAKARAAEALPLLEEALALHMVLRRDNYVLNDADLLLTARMYEAVVSGDMRRMEAAGRAAEHLAPWCLRVDVLHRALLLRHGLRRLAQDVKLGRVRLDSPELDVRWQGLRELFVSLARDRNAGRFADLSAAAVQEVAKLDALRAAMAPGRGRSFLTEPGDAKARADLDGVAARLIAHLRPAVDSDAPAALAQAESLLRDVAANLRAEAGRVLGEVEAINKEAGPGGPEPKDRAAFRELMKEAQRPNPGRERFSEVHGERMACHAIAVAKVLDVWQANGRAADATDGTAALNILAEFLAHLEEHTYDKILSIYKTAYGTPVIFTVAARQFYTEAAPMLSRLGEWADRLAAGRGAELMKVQGYTELLRSAHKDTRHRAAMASLASHRAFLGRLDGARSQEARRLALQAMLTSGEESPAYWELLRLALGDLAERSGTVAGRAQAPDSPGMTPGNRKGIEAAIARVRGILPAAAEAPPETKPLPGLLDGFADLARRAGAAALASRPDEDRRATLEDLGEWHGRLLAAMQGMDARVARPPLRYRPRLRYQRTMRTDLEHRFGHVLRNEARWSRRVAEARWDARAARAQGLEGTLGRDDVCWLAAFEQVCRRKSAAAAAQQSRALDLESGEPDERFLKMPLYLYKELRRALTKPYPTQFKQPALEYMRGLVSDAR